MCVKKLPKMLAIQLKRFDYDWERDCPIKFNDYFEFPREIDMEPYTVYGLAKIEGTRCVSAMHMCVVVPPFKQFKYMLFSTSNLIGLHSSSFIVVCNEALHMYSSL